MKFKRNLLILSAILIGVLIVVAGCMPAPTTPPAEGDVPSGGTISIAGGAATTNDTTPTLTLSSTGATHMAFSGNGTTWSSWVTYATSYSTFNITTGAGCTSGDGTKIVYVKFKNDAGESIKTYDTIILDTVAPKLSTAVYTDVDSSGTVNKGDKITFTFTDEMDITTVTGTNVATTLLLSGSKSYGTSPEVSWDSALKICYVTLGTSPTLVVGATTVNPSASVTDTAGNADASSDVTISTTTVLSSVTISPASKTYIEGDTTTTTFTAVAKNTAGTDITSLCSITWSESGLGSISPATGSSTVYTPPSTGTGTNTITASATYLGVAKTKTAIVTINAAATDTTAPTATLTAPEAGARTALVVTFNETLNALTLAIDDIADLLASATNDAEGIPVAIPVASVASSVSWNTANVNAPVATITIPSTTFVRSRIVRLNFLTDHVQDLKGNAILTATNVDATVVDTTAPTAPTAVTLAPAGGTVVANTANGTNTNLTFAATITAGEATGGKAEFYVGATKIGTDTTIAAADTSVTFDPAYTSTTTLQAGITAGGVVTCKLYDAAGNVVTSTASNPTLIVDYIAPTATITTTGDNNGAIVVGETLVLTFSEAMTPTVINAANIDAMIVPSGGKTHLDGAAAIGSAVWSVGDTVLTVTYSAGTSVPTIIATGTLTPTGFTDVAMNVIAPVVYTVLGTDF